jgi:alkanesulfonate monooxygenase SsuD/methylene tetrahydromethanopterin reductase-like flavin-dependent oxidoreductase (luciferase family)
MTELSFGLSVSTSAENGADPVAAAQRAEALGFDFISAPDHPEGTDPTLETWTMLAWIAASTSRLGIASKVLGVPFRPPALTAKMAETMDRLSNGRLILGLGGGYSDDEIRALGLPARTPGEKITGLEDTIHILRGLWSQQRFSYHGTISRVDAAEMEPKPRRRIPIWLGTFGPRALDLTGRLADGWIPSIGFAPPEVIPDMRARILAGAREAGRDPREITCAYHMQTCIDPPSKQPAGVVAGSPEEVAEQLLSFIGLGFTAMNFSPTGPGTDEQIERLAREVLPMVRAGSRESRLAERSAARGFLT